MPSEVSLELKKVHEIALYRRRERISRLRSERARRPPLAHALGAG
jgi:hypothetical protein